MAESPITFAYRPYSVTDGVMSAVGATLLIVTELLGAVFAFAWAIGGLIGLSQTLTYALMAIVGLPSLYAALMLTRRILRVEAKIRANPPGS
jgi:hypothetical protein